MAKKKKAKKTGVVKFQSFIKRDKSVKSKTKKVTELERKLNAAKKEKARAKTLATKKYNKKHCKK